MGTERRLDDRRLDSNRSEREVFDWQTPARDYGTPLEEARALYHEALREASRAGTRAEDLYLTLLKGVRPIPGRIALAAKRDPDRRADARRLPTVPGRRTLVENLDDPQPLPAETRTRMEAAFGQSFADVRLHVDSPEVPAGEKAFARGSDIFFERGAFGPGTKQGEEIVAHELAHVAQHTGPARGRSASPDVSALEADARRAARDALAGRPASVHYHVSSLMTLGFTGTNPDEAGPCGILTDELDNAQLLLQLNRARVYLHQHRRDEGQFYDYANFLARLDRTRRSRVRAGHVWLAEPGLLYAPKELYRLRQGRVPLELIVERASASSTTTRAISPGNTLLTPAQLRRFLESQGVPTIDAASYFAMRDPSSTEPLRVDLPGRPRRAYVQLAQDGGFTRMFGPQPLMFPGMAGGPFSGTRRPHQFAPFGPSNPFGPFMGQPASPSEQVFGIREITHTPSVATTLDELNTAPSSVTSSGAEQVYLPVPGPAAPMRSSGSLPWAGLGDEDHKYSPLLGAGALNPLLHPGASLPAGTTGFMWEGSHASDFVVIDGRFFIRGFRASMLRHGLSDAERAITKRFFGHGGGGPVTATLNRGTPGTYANDALFPYLGATAVVRADGTPVNPDEIIRLMRDATTRLHGERYGYTHPSEGSPAYRRAFGDLAPGVCPPGAANCINQVMDVHDATVGSKRVIVLPQEDGTLIDLAQPEHASARNMNRYIYDLPEEFFTTRGLRRVPVSGAMWRGMGMSTGVGVGASVLGNLGAAARGQETHFGRDAGINLVSTPVTTMAENYATNAMTHHLLAAGYSRQVAGAGGRIIGGTGVAAAAAPIITGGSMLAQEIFSDADYTSIDYSAAMGRSAVSAGGGALAGALAAGGAGALAGSEVPLLGNAVGFVVGFAGYFLIDWFVGDDVEQGIRRGLGEYGCTGGVGPGR